MSLYAQLQGGYTVWRKLLPAAMGAVPLRWAHDVKVVRGGDEGGVLGVG